MFWLCFASSSQLVLLSEDEGGCGCGHMPTGLSDMKSKRRKNVSFFLRQLLLNNHWCLTGLNIVLKTSGIVFVIMSSLSLMFTDFHSCTRACGQRRSGFGDGHLSFGGSSPQSHLSKARLDGHHQYTSLTLRYLQKQVQIIGGPSRTLTDFFWKSLLCFMVSLIWSHNTCAGCV